ncbi:MAG: alpha/beta hydrolase [Patescibacteria group bacterium]|nr:alpha/beta hydrolase [Patescibacteria group bacterium]
MARAKNTEPGEKTWAWLKEIWRLLTKYAYAALYRHPPAYYLGLAQDGKAPLVLLPGLTNGWSTMKYLADKLARRGHPVYIIGELGSNMQAVSSASHIAHSFIERHDLRGVILVAHSKGGLVGKYYLMHENANERVRGMVAIAAPFGGSRPARALPLEVFKELSQDSPLLRELAESVQVNSRIVSIYPAYDTHALIPDGSRLEGALGNVEIQTGGHNALLFDGRVVRETIHAIEKLSA